eukprot:492539-Rhodomonas_salina.3
MVKVLALSHADPAPRELLPHRLSRPARVAATKLRSRQPGRVSGARGVTRASKSGPRRFDRRENECGRVERKGREERAGAKGSG